MSDAIQILQDDNMKSAPENDTLLDYIEETRNKQGELENEVHELMNQIEKLEKDKN